MTTTQSAVHRRLHRHDKGPDVGKAQDGINRKATKLRLPWLNVAGDSEVGPRTEHSASLVLYAMGVYGPSIKRIRGHHEIDEHAQRLLRGSKRRNPIMVALALKRRGTVRMWRKAHDEPVIAPTEASALHDLINLIAKNMPYVFGGGHVTPANAGPGDCSWLASRERQHWEPNSPTGTTFTLVAPGEGLEGLGVEFSLRVKNIAGRPDESHVIEEWKVPRKVIQELGLEKWVVEWFQNGNLGVLFSECGGSDNPTPGNGPSFFIPGEGMGLSVAARLAEFPEHRHPVGA